VEVAGQIESLFQDGNQQINVYSDPDLGFDGVGRCAIKGFDSQMLLDPAEEELHLPALLVNIGDFFNNLLMGLTSSIGTGQVAADLDRRRDEAAPLGLANVDLLGDLVCSSKDELRTALVFFADFGHEAGAGSRKFNIVYIDLFPESGVK
jgi:hypothetical protein